MMDLNSRQAEGDAAAKGPSFGKAVASDFDNTIYYLDDEEKNLENAKAIQEFVHQGNCFCIITGRNYSDLKNNNLVLLI